MTCKFYCKIMLFRMTDYNQLANITDTTIKLDVKLRGCLNLIDF